MKVLILANSDSGLYQFRKELLDALIVQNHEVHISLPEGQWIPTFQEMGCHTHITEMERRGTNPVKDLGLMNSYRRLMKRINPDIVFTYTIKPNVYGGMVCSMMGVPYAANITGLGTAVENGGMMQKITLTLYRMGLRKAKKVFFQNKENQKFMLSHGVVKGEYVLLPGSGVNLTRFTPLPYPEEQPIRFLFIGRIMKDKGIGELLAAAKMIKEKYPSVVFDIVGGFDENYADVIVQVVEEDLVCYHGVQKDVRPFIEKAQCVVLPSYHEGMSNVLLEGAASGRALIATKVPGCKETFDEGVSGFGCEAKDAVSLAAAMESFIQLSYADRMKMGLAGRDKVEREFDRNIVVNTYLDVLKTLSCD